MLDFFLIYFFTFFVSLSYSSFVFFVSFVVILKAHKAEPMTGTS